MSDRIRQMILERRPAAEIKQAAREEGMTFLRDSALEKVFAGADHAARDQQGHVRAVKRLAQNLLLSLVRRPPLRRPRRRPSSACSTAVTAGPAPEATGPTAEHYRFNGYHPLLGYDGLPGVRGRFHGQTVTHNSKGNRGPEAAFEKPHGRAAGGGRWATRRPGATGWATTTPSPPSSRRLLNEGGGAPYEVLNLGVGGYGTDQAFLKYLAQGRRYSPDAVVLTTFKNDPVENAAHRLLGGGESRASTWRAAGCAWATCRPRARRAGPTTACSRTGSRASASRAPSFDLARTATARFFLRREWLPSLLARDDSGLAVVREHVGCIRNRDAYEGDGMEILTRLVAELKKITAGQGARLVLLLVPRSKEVEDPSLPAYYDPALARFRAQDVAYVDLRRRLGHARRRGAVPAQRPAPLGRGQPHRRGGAARLPPRGSAMRLKGAGADTS